VTHRTPIRILIADDHPIFRDGLKRLLQAEPDFEVIGEAADGEQAVAQSATLAPDILLLDVSMPRVGGFDALRALATAATPVRVIVLTAGVEKGDILTAIELGARGIVLKHSATEDLYKSIRSVMDGQYWIGRGEVADLVTALREARAERQAAIPAREYNLTPRERQIAGAVVSGQTNREIARQLKVTEDTVKHHMTSIFDKLGVSNRLELALFVINHRLVERDT
jgi:two-component system nitrate/nitrite response regulator NarL